tara:strand:+ start:175 stop:366 length:192 start_codon:yes stop_codon:yes gene_type:complete
MEQLKGYLTTDQASRRLKMGYWKFIRKALPKLSSIQLTGKYGQHFFRETDIERLCEEIEKDDL